MPSADELLGIDQLIKLRSALSRAGVATQASLEAVEGKISGATLRQRADLIGEAVLSDIPGSFSERATTIRQALADNDFRGWLIWPVSEAMSAAALADGSEESFDDGMSLLAELTPRLTCEFALRPMLLTNLDRAMTIVQEWALNSDEHVRRLASEGTRLFLPWGTRVPRLGTAPRTTLPILDSLYRDPSEMVRRSVANHLNDLSREHPEIVIETARRWLDHPDGNTAALVKHALRTLVKRGHPDALAMLGFGASDALLVRGPEIDVSEVAIGSSLSFSVEVENAGDAPLKVAIDYIVHHRKANGGQTAKVFKLATRNLVPGEAVALSRQHSFAVISTRAYYPGEHAIEVQVNGRASGRVSFVLTG